MDRSAPRDESSEGDTTLRLVERVQRGDSDALSQLMARFLPRLRNWATGRVPANRRDLADTSDFVQDVLLQSFRKVEALEVGREGGFQAYLRQAVLNRIRDEFRRVSRRPDLKPIQGDLAASAASPLEQVIGRESLDRYESALATLRPGDREAIIARLELGYPYDEVATLIGKPTANAARVAVARAVKRLIQRLSE